MVENDKNAQKHAAKRQRMLEDTTGERRAAFEEDMARIRSALADSEGNTGAQSSTGSNHGVNNENGEGMDEMRQLITGSTIATIGGGAGLHAPEEMDGDNNKVEKQDDDGGDDADNWLQNYTPHHTRIGPNYQVTDLPTVSCRPASNNAAAVASCVSPGET